MKESTQRRPGQTILTLTRSADIISTRRCLPWPPQEAAGLGRGAQRRQVCLPLQALRQSALHVLNGQDVFRLLDTRGTIHSGKVQSPALLLQPSQDPDGLLQDVCFLQLGVWLLLEAWTQERLELLNAAVDPLSP